MTYQSVWDRVYVYNAEGTEEFRQVRITLEISDKQGRVTLQPHHMMTVSEIDAVMMDYNAHVLERMLTPYDVYYPVRLVFNDVECKIEFDSQRRVTGIEIL